MSFYTYYDTIKEKVQADKEFLASFPFFDTNTKLMQDERVIRQAVFDYLEDFSKWPTKPSAGDHINPRFWFLSCWGGQREPVPPGGIIDGNHINFMTRDHIQLPYFLGTRLKLDLKEFCELLYDESLDSWVWPLLMEFINHYIADGILASQAPYFESMINGTYSEQGRLLEPALKDLTTSQQQRQFYSPPYLYRDTDDVKKLDQGRNKMYSHFKAMFKNCELITQFLESKGLVNNDIYTDFLYMRNLVKQTMGLAEVANAYQLHAYFSDIVHVYSFHPLPVLHQHENVFISKMERMCLDDKVTYMNAAHNIESNCAFSITQPIRERERYKFESLKSREYLNWSATVRIVDTFTKTEFEKRKFDILSDIPALKAFTPYILTSRYEIEKGYNAEYPQLAPLGTHDSDIYPLQVVDHIIDTNDIVELAQKSIPPFLIRVLSVLQIPIKLIQNMILNFITKKYKMFYIMMKINKFFRKNKNIIKILDIISTLQKTSPLAAAFQLILLTEKHTHPFFKRGRYIDCDDIPMAVSAFMPIMELVLEEILDMIDIKNELVSLNPEESKLLIKYLSGRIVKEIL